MRLWEIRLRDGSYIISEIEDRRNLTAEFDKLWFWKTAWKVTPELVLRKAEVICVQPWLSPAEAKKLFVKHNPEHPQKAPPKKGKTNIRGFNAN